MKEDLSIKLEILVFGFIVDVIMNGHFRFKSHVLAFKHNVVFDNIFFVPFHFGHMF